jgi:tetratricopeptide (TPR) repeat protein
VKELPPLAKIDQIRRMLASEPNDLLLNYALAMELFSAGAHEEALAQFDRVLAVNPAYSAAYMQKAKALIELGRHADAKAVLQAGIDVAERRGDLHAKDKMEELLRAVR